MWFLGIFESYESWLGHCGSINVLIINFLCFLIKIIFMQTVHYLSYVKISSMSLSDNADATLDFFYFV